MQCENGRALRARNGDLAQCLHTPVSSCCAPLPLKPKPSSQHTFRLPQPIRGSELRLDTPKPCRVLYSGTARQKLAASFIPFPLALSASLAPSAPRCFALCLV